MGAEASSLEATLPFPPAWMPNATPEQLEEAVIAMREISSTDPDQLLRVLAPLPDLKDTVWDLDSYHTHAAAAVASDIGLNRLVYKCVPKRVPESEFWRCYFCWAYRTLEALAVEVPSPSKAITDKEERVADDDDAETTTKISMGSLTSAQADEVRRAVARSAGVEDQILIDLVLAHLEAAANANVGVNVEALTDELLPELAELYGVKGGEDRAAELASTLAGLHEQALALRKLAARRGDAGDAGDAGEHAVGVSSGPSVDSKNSSSSQSKDSSNNNNKYSAASRRERARGLLNERPVWPFTEMLGPYPEDRAAADSRKGMGVFAIRTLAEGDLVGLYLGEKLTLREFNAHHTNVRGGDGAILSTEGQGQDHRRPRGSVDAILDRATEIQRRERLGASRAPPGINAEDPKFSSWCRYLNHARGSACNADQQVDAEGRVWFVANKEIAPGTEICFDYGDEYWLARGEEPLI